VQFDDDGNITRGYRGTGWDGHGDAEGPGKVVKGLSGEAVRILKEPGPVLLCDVQTPSDAHRVRAPQIWTR
jgi:5-oxoprolinase (ATP-hydrolysing)